MITEKDVRKQVATMRLHESLHFYCDHRVEVPMIRRVVKAFNKGNWQSFLVEVANNPKEDGCYHVTVTRFK